MTLLRVGSLAAGRGYPLMSSLESPDPALFEFELVLNEARLGRQTQLGKLLDCYRGYLLTIAMEKLAPELVAKVAPSDVVQQSLLEATQGFAEFSGRSEPELRAWLIRILVHQVVDTNRYYKHFAKRDVLREIPLQPVFQSSSGDPIRSLRDTDITVSPSAMAKRSEQVSIVRAALQKLNEESRQLIQLRSYEQLEFAEIGKRIGRPADTARKLWSRAVQKLAVELQLHKRDLE